jgi:hypothetical protein
MAEKSGGFESQLSGRRQGRAIITASSAMEYAFEGDQVAGTPGPASSSFTSALVEGLKSGAADLNQDGLVTLDELYEYIWDEVRMVTPSQTPQKWTFGMEGDLVIARRAEPPDKPSPLPPELQKAIDSPLAAVRARAVRELERVLQGTNAGQALTARLTLEMLTGDDSLRVADAATAALGLQVQSPAPPRPEREAAAAAESVTEEQETQNPQLHQPKIFLCYRRDDTQGFARGIYENLAGKYGREQVYRDIDSTPAGVRYATWIESRVSQCDVMLVLIGNNWSSAKDLTGQRRLDLPKDWVRHEIEAALRREIPIIPVFVQGAPMPSENELPASISDLTGFQSAEVTDSRWEYDVRLLIEAIDNLILSA